MTLLKRRQMVLKAFESEVFSKLQRSEQSSSNVSHTSSKLNNDLFTSINK